MNIERERAEFEAWYAAPNNNGTAWEAWQARAVLQSPEAQALIAENAKLVGLVSEMAENGTYETEYDGCTYEICHGCGAQDGEDHRRLDCVYVRANAAIKEPKP